MHDQPERVRSRGDLLLATLSVGLPVAIYNLLLVLTGTALLRAALRRALPGRSWTWVAGLGAGAAYFAVVTVHFDVYRYFRDGIDLGVAKDLGGGSLGRALAFVRAELMGLLPLVLSAVAGGVAWIFLCRRFGRRISGGLGGSGAGRRFGTARGILLANVMVVLLPGAALAVSDRLERTLGKVEAHRLYRVPLAYLTDFDGDGFGLMTRPFDHAPFDGSRHPYARDIPGNGIDENGVGGDLPRAEARPPMEAWDGRRLERKNVLLVVLETARYDLLDAVVDGQPVMPALAAMPGQRLRVISHFAFTGPAICGIFNGTISDAEEGTSLIDRFRAFGYATGVFSGQPEDHADIARRTGMDRADVRWDASLMPAERMYAGADLNSLVVPGHLPVGELAKWIGTLGDRRFFAYLNLQEMHFPYDSKKIPATLLDEPIPRSEITEANRDWLLRTYWNAARRVDTVLGMAIETLRASGRLEETLVLVVGDHGEELFHHGYLGHGVNISHEQNETFLKLVNGTIDAPEGPIGHSDIGRVIHNALARDPADRMPIGGPVLAIVGGPVAPRQIGLFDATGLRKYDFSKDAWTREDGPGGEPRRMDEDPAVIHAWESYALAASR
ncbi:MAG: sulfatase-like hydrolase/transferase [Planctomycetes bacterium]|nr:sulfatase-like hydrolase/transferase [Planctomycetota bacterium]